MDKMQKNTIRAQNIRALNSKSIINFSGSYREKWLGSSVGRAED